MRTSITTSKTQRIEVDHDPEGITLTVKAAGQAPGQWLTTETVRLGLDAAGVLLFALELAGEAVMVAAERAASTPR